MLVGRGWLTYYVNAIVGVCQKGFWFLSNLEFKLTALISRSRAMDNLWMQSKLLHSPVTDLSHIQLVLVTTIDGIDGAEFLRQFSGPAKLAHNLACRFQLVNLAVGVDIIRRV